jgi:hypothetical protein
MLYLFSESKSVAVKEQVTKSSLGAIDCESSTHPWGLLITFIELIKNQRYGSESFLYSLRHRNREGYSRGRPILHAPGAQRTTLVGGEEQ